MKRSRLLARGIRAIGTILLVLLAAACIPLTLPRLAGYQIYSVISGSMEPAVPVGSLVYIKTMEPADMQEGDVIAYYAARDSASIITHRVVENRVLMGELVTKGDANQAADVNPVPYDHFIGKVQYSVPGVGKLAEFFTSRVGKAAAGGLIAAAVLLHILASAVEWEPKKDRKEAGDGR